MSLWLHLRTAVLILEFMLLTFTFVVYFKFPVVTESGQYGASSFAIQNIM